MQMNSRWMDKENMVHEYNGVLFSLKNKESLQCVITYMNFEDILLSEKRQS